MTINNNLTFSYYIDWFNPFTNKISRKSVSCRAILMFCLNLPYELQFLPENTFFAGITPPPKEPTITTIMALADPIVDGLEAMWHGKVICTHCHPGGILKCAAVLPAIGDLLAMRKALGFAGVPSHNFCSFCMLRRSGIEDLDYQTWKPRIGADVYAAGQEWKKAMMKKKRKEIFDEHGIHWSSLQHLQYRDPVRHTILGVMHNWLESVLQHQVHFKWGIGVVPSSTEAETNDSDPLSTNPPSPASTVDAFDLDVDMLEEELQSLHDESQIFQDMPSHIKHLQSESSILQLDEWDLGNDIVDGADGDDLDFQPESESESEDKEAHARDEDEIWRISCVLVQCSCRKFMHASQML